MPLSPTDLIQSFRLRFWRESLEEGTGAWRGDVWHEQQAPEQKATVVVSPEAAFDLVRRALQRSPPPHPAGFHVAERDGRRHAVRYDIGGGAEAAGRAALDLAKTPENATMTAARAIGGGMASWTRHSISPIRRLLILSPELASFRRRGFAAADRSKQTALELIGRTFIGGYNAAVAGGIEDVLRHVAAVAHTERGFAAEGATMAAAVIDAVRLRRSLLPTFIDAFRHDFTYLAHVGAGWSLARVPWRSRQVFAGLAPIHCWLAFEGLGFHDTDFDHRRVLRGWRRKSSGYPARAYDQGVGRALWFVAGGSAADAVNLIAAFREERRRDLWSGLGLAMAYAGPTNGEEVVSAFRSAGTNGIHYAQGIAFACEARAAAGYVPAHTSFAADAVWGADAEILSALVRDRRAQLPPADGDVPRYELWRQAIAADFRRSAGVPS